MSGNPVVFFDLVDSRQYLGRIEFELFAREVPMTVENFRSLCTGERSTPTEKLHYKGSFFHRIIPGFIAQGGDFTMGNGTGGKSIYGRKFEDENFFKHTGRGILSMANSGPNTNGSQFFITMKDCPSLDGKHVVFGYVSKGLEVLAELEKRGSQSGTVSERIYIAECGQLR
eukprot:TRINITY_DN4704_c0_g2_i1.p1 TRINITY_DN4704_c0_g2~~TRINITY_DN4704_c0_g2_i1.p1  ORF type:complete len:171 (+),score=60.66 TRINITY_DN4704_c0_g2_i1:160-672(+)